MRGLGSPARSSRPTPGAAAAAVRRAGGDRGRLARAGRRLGLVRRAPADPRARGRAREPDGGRRWPPPPAPCGRLLAALVWVVNPYAAALLLPAAHVWLFAAAPGSRLRGRARRRRGRRRARCRPPPFVLYYAARARPRPARAGVDGLRWPSPPAGSCRSRSAWSSAGLLACLRRRWSVLRARRRVTRTPSPSRCGRAARSATRAPARSGARSRRCGDDRHGSAPALAPPCPASAVQRADRGGRPAARRRGDHAAVAGAGVGALRPAPAGRAQRRPRRARAAPLAPAERRALDKLPDPARKLAFRPAR